MSKKQPRGGIEWEFEYTNLKTQSKANVFQ